MKTNYVPAIVMLLAGVVYCLFSLRADVTLMDFTVQLLIVLVLFYILGGIIRMVLDNFMEKLATKEEVSDETQTAQQETIVEEKPQMEETSVEEEEI